MVNLIRYSPGGFIPPDGLIEEVFYGEVAKNKNSHHLADPSEREMCAPNAIS